jgi:hypothetical protein
MLAPGEAFVGKRGHDHRLQLEGLMSFCRAWRSHEPGCVLVMKTCPDNYRIGIKISALKKTWRLVITAVFGVSFSYFFLDEKVSKKSMRFANLDFSLGVLNTLPTQRKIRVRTKAPSPAALSKTYLYA